MTESPKNYRLKSKGKLSRRAAHEMILLFAKHGNHNYNVHFESDADVERVLAYKGVDFKNLVEACRDCKQPVPFFENKLGGTWKVGVGLTASRMSTDGQEDIEVSGPGEFSLTQYQGTFELAMQARDRAIANNSYMEFQTAIVQGIASIEGYINYRTEFWNKKHPEDLLIDSFQNKVSFSEKVNVWIPKMTGGRKLDKSDTAWRNFIILCSIRDNVAIHPKVSGLGISLTELAEKINLFQTGIAEILIRLHILFSERIPAKVIRAKYMPEVELVEELVSSA